MDLEARKILFVQEFLRLQSEEVVSGLENLLRKKRTELLEENMKPMSLQQFNKEIDQAIEDSEKGRLTKASDLKEKMKKWA